MLIVPLLISPAVREGAAVLLLFLLFFACAGDCVVNNFVGDCIVGGTVGKCVVVVRTATMSVKMSVTALSEIRTAAVSVTSGWSESALRTLFVGCSAGGDVVRRCRRRRRWSESASVIATVLGGVGGKQ